MKKAQEQAHPPGKSTVPQTPISPLQNAVDSLRRLSRELAADTRSPLSLKGALAWGWHAVGLLAYLRLRPQRHLFDAWVQDYLETGSPALEVERDAHWEEKERLSFLELLDLFSASELSMLNPGFYQGWQERTTRCQALRAQAAHIVGGHIDAAQRQDLLLLLAAYHRLIRLPADVELDAATIWQAFPALLDLTVLLIDQNSPGAEVAQAEVARCRGLVRR